MVCWRETDGGCSNYVACMFLSFYGLHSSDIKYGMEISRSPRHMMPKFRYDVWVSYDVKRKLSHVAKLRYPMSETSGHLRHK